MKVFWIVRYKIFLKSSLEKNIDSSSVTLDAKAGKLLQNLNWYKGEGSEVETAFFIWYWSKYKVRENCMNCPHRRQKRQPAF